MSNQDNMLNQQLPQTAQQRPQTVREQQLRRQQQQTEHGLQSREKAPNPPAELSENYEWMRLTVDLPGVQLKDLDVDINHGVLTIEGVRRTMTVDGSVCVKKQKVSRRYAIDTDVVDMQKVSANLKFGVLTIKAPKKSKPNRVRVAVTEDDEGVSLDRNVMVSTQSNMSVETQPNMSVAPVTTTVSTQPNMSVETQPNMSQPNIMSLAPVTTTVSTQPNIMSVAPVTTTPHIAAPMQAAPTHISAPMQAAPTRIAAPMQAAPTSFTRDEEALAMSLNPPAFTSRSPQGVSVKVEHGVVQPDDGINDSGTDNTERIHAYEKI
jgi:HSP20 family protein